MKQVFYTGLLALTIAFGVTSCDKNDVGEVNGPLTSVTKGITSKVSFGENDLGIAVKGDEASKTAGEFDHIYSSIAQSIAIADSDGAIVFSGSYAAGDIASGITGDEGYAVPIILQNGVYVAETMNEGGEGIGYLPYSSRAEFTLNSDTGTIELIPAYTHGFVIVNVEDAEDGSRVTGATASVGELSIDFLVDDRDSFGDFFGYLPAETYDLVASYNLDGVSTDIPGTQRVAAGLAYTINLMLTEETPAVVGSIVSTSTLDGLESAIGENGAGRDINDDGDLLDTLVRIVTSTQATLNGEATDVAPVVTNGPWSVVTDNDISVVVSSEESTELAEDEFVNSDTDKFDTLTRVVTTTTASINDEAGTPAIVNGEWTILADHSEAGFGEVPGTSQFAVRAYSDWSPLVAAPEFATVDQTRTITNADASFDPAVAAESLERTIANPDSVVDVADEYLSASSSASVGGVASTINDGDAVVTVAEAASDVEMVTETTTQATLDNVSEIVVTTTTVYTIQINVREDVPALAAKDDLVETDNTPATSVAGTPVVTTREIANPDYSAPVEAAVWAAVDGVYSNSDFPLYTFTIDLDPVFNSYGYILTTDGVLSDAIIGELDTEAEAIALAIADIAAL